MRIIPDWLDDAENAAQEERGTVCDFKLWIAEQNACLHRDALDGKNYDLLTLAAYHLANGVAHNWWRIFGARDHDFRLIQHRMGYAVPDIRFKFDGAAFEVWAEAYQYTNPGISFWTVASEVMTRAEAEEILAGFVDATLSRLERFHLADSGAALRWKRVQASRKNPEETVFCEAAGSLGCDPYSLSEEDAALIEAAGDLFSGELLIEFLAGIGSSSRRQDSLKWIDFAERRLRHYSRLPELADISRQVAGVTSPRSEGKNWALGYRRARAVRLALRIEESRQFSSVAELAGIFGSKSFRRAPDVNSLRALVTTKDDGNHIHLRNRDNTRISRLSELFAFARALGDAICFPGTPRAVINDLWNADRQAASRAFAAEFLAPINEILSMAKDGNDTDRIASRFNVSTEVISHQISNKNRILQACA
ncbi:conserved hypothetical protein [uncultured Gammaproteobacteria bacterium]